jgi:hypothetical protein
MSEEEARQLIQAQVRDALNVTSHGVSLQQALVPPERISIVDRAVKEGVRIDEVLSVWLVGREGRSDGNQFIMSEDGHQFGLALCGFPVDRHPVLIGWYGDLLSAFTGM